MPAPGHVPDFFIVGHPKCGTTALYEMLKRHPQIFMPDFKEPWYFAGDMRPRFQPARTGAVPETLDDYLSLFEPAGEGQTLGEASSSYLRSREAPGRIAELRPDARIIAIFREPASFLVSLHHQLLLDHIETSKDLRAALALEPARREGRRVPRRSHLPQMLLYSDHVRYAEQLRRYRESFAAEQILVLVYEDFRADNAGTLRQVQQFLGVREEPEPEALEANTSSVRMRSQRIDGLLHSVSVGTSPASRAAKGLVKAVTSSALRDRAMRAMRRSLVYGEPVAPDQTLMLEIRRRYKAEAEALGECLGRDLVSLWRYDRLG
jgi:Sulfotransferase domain